MGKFMTPDKETLIVEGKYARFAINGNSEGIDAKIIEEAETWGRIYTSTVQITSSVGHILTTPDGKDYTVMPGDKFIFGLPLNVGNGNTGIFTYEISVRKIRDFITDARTAIKTGGAYRSGRVRAGAITADKIDSGQITYASSFAIGRFPYDQFDIEDPFGGFEPRKPKAVTKKEKEETAEEIERKLTQFGTRKFGIK